MYEKLHYEASKIKQSLYHKASRISPFKNECAWKNENKNSDFYGKKTPATYFQKLIIYYLIYLYFDLDSE